MAVKDIFKISRKTFFNPSEWLGYKEVKGTIRTTWDIVKGLFVTATPTRTESFEEAIERLGLTEEDVATASRNYEIYTVLFVILGAFAFIVAFYFLIMHLAVFDWAISLLVTALFLVQAFRFSFWHFQIKHRKLGCTFAEWKRGKIDENSEGQS